MRMKFFLIASSVRTPQKSLIILQIRLRISSMNEGEAFTRVVQTRKSPFFFMYMNVIPSRFWIIIREFQLKTLQISGARLPYRASLI